MTRKEILKRAKRYTQIVMKYCINPWDNIDFKDVINDILYGRSVCTLELLEDMEIETDSDEHAKMTALAMNLEILNHKIDEMGEK